MELSFVLWRAILRSDLDNRQQVLGSISRDVAIGSLSGFVAYRGFDDCDRVGFESLEPAPCGDRYALALTPLLEVSEPNRCEPTGPEFVHGCAGEHRNVGWFDPPTLLRHSSRTRLPAARIASLKVPTDTDQHALTQFPLPTAFALRLAADYLKPIMPP